MKKLIFVLLCLPLMALADDCANAYEAGLDLYKQGKYAEAQIKFIAVAQICPNYSDVWNKMKNCNKKLVEKQSQQATQIAALKTENKQLDKAAKEASFSTKGSGAIQALSTINRQKAELDSTRSKLNAANDSIVQLKGMLQSASDTIDAKCKKIASLNNQIANMKVASDSHKNKKKKTTAQEKEQTKNSRKGKKNEKKQNK